MADETEIKFRFTTKGQQVSAAILGGKDKIEFTKAVASIDVHANDTDADVANIIDLDNKKQIADIHDVVAVKNNIVQIPIKFEKNKITEDYQLNTIGIYAKYQDQEFLYAFGALKYPIYMHHTDDSGVFKMYTYITVGTVANVVIKTDNTESVSRDDLSRILVDYPTKSDIAGKANIADVYTKDEVNELVESAGKVKTVNGQNGDITIPVFAPNLLIGTSDEWDNLPYADTIWSQQITVQQGDIISASAILDTTKSTSAAIYIRMLNDSGGAVKDYIKGSTVTRSIGTSLLDKLVIPTGVTSIKCGIASDDNTNFASVKYKERKLAKWRDTNTPPDMTWLPNVDDTSTAINDLQNQITELKNRETYHIAADLSSGIAYSKSHPNVLVLMC